MEINVQKKVLKITVKENYKKISRSKFQRSAQGGKGAKIPGCSPLHPRPSADQRLLYTVLGFSARAGYKVLVAFRYGIPPSFTQTQGQK
jgi:hypothetical protein